MFERTTYKHLPRLMRAARKRSGLSQVEIARLLDTSQATVSKYESGISYPGAVEWFAFCDATKILPESIRSGFIDLGRPAVLRDVSRLGSFKIPEKYHRNQGEKVRGLYPVLSYLTSVLGGEAERDAYLKSRGLDPDFFVCLDEQLPIDFFADIVKYLLLNHRLDNRGLSILASGTRTPHLHGVLRSPTGSQAGPIDRLTFYLANMQHFDCDFAYDLLDQSAQRIDISIKPEAHIDSASFRHHPVLHDFFCQYKKHFLHALSSCDCAPAGSVSSVPISPISIDEKECYFKGASRCIYRIRQIA